MVCYNCSLSYTFIKYVFLLGETQWPKKCQILGCANEPNLGAHVYVKGRTGNTLYYILPACSDCNNGGLCRYDGKNWCKVKKGARVVATELQDCALEHGRRKTF